MNLHVLERASTHILAVFAVGGGVLASVVDVVAPEPMTAGQMFGVLAALVVAIMGALAAVLVRWLNNAGKTLPRSDNRLEHAIGEMRREIKTDLHDLNENVQSIDRRVARIEGSLGGLVVTEDRS